MKAKILKIAGVKSEAEFYKLYPTEESFMKLHGHKLMNKYGPGGETTDGCPPYYKKNAQGKCVPDEKYREQLNILNYANNPSVKSQPSTVGKPFTGTRLTNQQRINNAINQGVVSKASNIRTDEKVNQNIRNLNKKMEQDAAQDKKEEEQLITQRKAASDFNDGKINTFTFPNGTTKSKDQMDWRDKSYIDGLSLQNKGRFFPNKNSFIDNWLNPLNLIGTTAGGLATAPYEARESNSILPYVTSIGMPLLMGRSMGSGSINPLSKTFWTNEVSNKQFLNSFAGGIPGMVEGATKIGSRTINKLANKLADIPFNKSQGISSKFIPQELEQIPFEYIHPETGESIFVNASQSTSALPPPPPVGEWNQVGVTSPIDLSQILAGYRAPTNQQLLDAIQRARRTMSSPTLDAWRTIENPSQTGNIVPKIIKNKSGLTKEETLQKITSKDKDVVSKMTEQEFENTVLKPNGEIVNYEASPVVNSIPLTDDEYIDMFNQNIHIFDDLVQQYNKSGIQYKPKRLEKGTWGPKLTFETPPQYVVPEITPKQQQAIDLFRKDPIEFLKNKANLRQNANGQWETDTFSETFNSVDDAVKRVEEELKSITEPKTISGESSWDVGLNPGQWTGEVQDVANTNYYQSIPGLSMRNTSNSVFSDGMPRRGTGTYDALNEYLKRLNLGRVKPGFNSQTKYSLGAWENFINKNKAVGFYANTDPGLIYGTMKTVLPYAVPTAIGLTALDNANSNNEEPLPQQAYGGPLVDYYAGKMNHGEMFRNGGLIQYGPGGLTTDGCQPGFNKHPLTGDCVPNGWNSGVVNQKPVYNVPPVYEQATAADSTKVYNRALAVKNHYTSKGYTKHPVYNSDDADQERIKYEQDVKNKKFPDFQKRLEQVRGYANPWRYRKDGKVYKPNKKLGPPDVPIRPFKKDEKYYKPIDENQFEQRELSYGFLDMDAPVPLYDKRIVPQSYNLYKAPDSATNQDNVELYEYDPLAVKPYALRTPEEKVEWEKLYGNNSNAQTPVQQNQSVPKGDYVFGPANSVIGVVNNGVFTKVDMPEQRGGVNKADLELLNNEEALRKYVQQKGLKYADGGLIKAQNGLLWDNILKTPTETKDRYGYTFLQPNSSKLPQGYVIPYNTPNTELAQSVGGDNIPQYDVSYWNVDKNNWDLKTFNTEKESTDFANQMSRRGLSSGAGNITQTKRYVKNGPAFLIPGFKGGKKLENPLQEFKETREHLGGPFKTWQEAENFEKLRHKYVEKGQSVPTPLLPFGKEYMYASGGSVREKAIYPTGTRQPLSLNAVMSQNRMDRDNNSYSGGISKFATGGQANRFYYNKGYNVPQFYGGGGYQAPYTNSSGQYTDPFGGPGHGMPLGQQPPKGPTWNHMTVGNPNANPMQQPMNYGSIQVGNPQFSQPRNPQSSQPGWSYNRNNPNGNTQRASDGKNETFGKVLAGLGMFGMVAGAIGGLGKKQTPCGEGTIWDEKTKKCIVKNTSGGNQYNQQQPFQQPFQQPNQQDNFQLGKSLGQAMNNDQGIAWNYNPNIQSTQIQNPTNAPSDGPSLNTDAGAASSTARYGGNIFRSESKSRKYSKFEEGGLTKYQKKGEVTSSYQPSQTLNDVKAILSGLDAATGFSANPYVKGANFLTRAANSGLDGYTALRYAIDGQETNALTDGLEAIVDLLPYAKPKMSYATPYSKGKLQINKLGQAQNKLIKGAKGVASADDFMHSSLGRFLFGNPDSQVKYKNGGDISIPQLPTKNSPLLQFYYNNI